MRPIDNGAFELIHPPCVEETFPDYEEGLELRREGDVESARDALRFALQGCRDSLWIHVALGRIALEDQGDAELARGHFGYAFELVLNALPANFQGRLPRDRPANQPAFEAIEGLIKCFEKLKIPREVEYLSGMARKLEGSSPKSSRTTRDPD